MIPLFVNFGCQWYVAAYKFSCFGLSIRCPDKSYCLAIVLGVNRAIGFALIVELCIALFLYEIHQIENQSFYIIIVDKWSFINYA